MSPWTSLLESLHSALIDELIERHPEPKPELGMPIRQGALKFPFPSSDQILLTDVTLSWNSKVTPGFIIVALDAEAYTKLRLSSEDLWNLMQRRAGSEFIRRGIQPIFAASQTVSSSNPLPSRLMSSPRVIWIPFHLNPGNCFLAIATL